MADRLVPYAEGMTQGQGFNTYVQEGRMNKAVEVTSGARQDLGGDSVHIEYNSEQTLEYEKLAHTLEISAGAGLSKLGVGGKIDTKFFETSFLTYIVKVDVRKQPSAKLQYHFNWTSPSNPNETYGDRFISDFVTGGALFARVSIRTSDTTVHKGIEESAEIGFPMYGVDVKITQEMKVAMDRICKNSEVRIYIHYIGAPPGYQAQAQVFDEDNPLLQLKAQADKFLADAKDHDWQRFAILEKYTNISDFKDEFKPFNYIEAEERSWEVFNDFTGYFSVRDTIREIQEDHYEGGRSKKTSLDGKANDVVQLFRDWVSSVSADPSKAKQTPQVEPPENFRKEVLLAAKWTQFIGQSLHLPSGRTHIIDTKLHPNAKKLFEIRGFDFADVTRTAKVVFAKQRGENRYVCLIGQKTTPGYEELSHLWVFETQIRDISDENINVYDYPDQGVIELESEGRMGNEPLFNFYVRKG
ncbi:hypothetical protein CDD81_7362 [Ophiocordyceps australis]|uniref:Uncharacterized protein n=1 Tax=Ophiocordyceps australis TaxID=1399860 RepID=A0A2C5XGV5_9HYPO|nr:hypothetical protein CDD81_7362 [Ophiocordyceps australis]